MALEIKSFPVDYSKAFSEIDLSNPYVHTNQGLFELDSQTFNGRAYVYMPSDLECSAWSVTLLVPENADLLSFFTSSGWKDLADERKFLVFLAEAPKDGWSVSPYTLDFLKNLDAAVDDKTHYDAQRFCAYLAGYEDGACAALQYALYKPAAYAGLGLLFQAESAANDIATLLKQAELSTPTSTTKLPLFIETDQLLKPTESIVSHFIKRNQTSPDPLHGADGIIRYIASQKDHHNSVNEQPVSHIAIKTSSTEGSFINSDSAKIAWNELRRAIRTSGIGDGYLHPYRTLSDWHITKHETTIDSVLRHWYEYIPQQATSREEKRPLVIFLHGGSQTGQTCLYATEWMNVAEERNFIFAAPTGTMRNFGSSGAPHPAWNACGSHELFNDEAFIKTMIADICSRNNIDRSRIYIAGHSMGSAMAQRCALAMPELFAAVASNSGVVVGGFMGDFDSPGVKEDIAMPAIWIQMGEHDVGGGTLESNHNAERTVRYWIKRGDLDSFDDARTVTCGRYLTKTWQTKKGTPLLSFTTTLDKPHAITPEDAWLYYDSFFCKFSRDETGSLNYLGKPV